MKSVASIYLIFSRRHFIWRRSSSWSGARETAAAVACRGIWRGRYTGALRSFFCERVRYCRGGFDLHRGDFPLAQTCGDCVVYRSDRVGGDGSDCCVHASRENRSAQRGATYRGGPARHGITLTLARSEEHTSELQSPVHLVC